MYSNLFNKKTVENKLPYKTYVHYGNSNTNRFCNPYTGKPEITEFGYSPPLRNPGGLQFYSYYYSPSRGGRSINNSGPGWRNYQKTGSYDSWW
jgi:hypothetical protein